MALPTFVSAGTPAGGTGTVTPGLPSGWQQDDIFLLVVETPANTNTPPAGWTAVTNSPQGDGSTTSTFINVYWRRATASESAPTVPDSGNHTYAVILAFRGCPTSGNPWNVTSGGSESTQDTSPLGPGRHDHDP